MGNHLDFDRSIERALFASLQRALAELHNKNVELFVGELLRRRIDPEFLRH